MTDLAPRSLPAVSDRALDRWVGGLSEHTGRGYRYDVREWLAWCAANGVDAGHPIGPDVTEHLASLELGDASKARRYAAIQSFYAWARDEGLTDADPKPPKSQRPRVKGDDAAHRVGLTEDEAQRLMAAALADTPRSAALIALMLTTGLRISETLRVDELDHKPGRTTVTVLGKGRKKRTVVVPPLAVELCEKIAEPGRPLFRTRTGRRLTTRYAYTQVHRLGRAAGIEHVHPHLLRHTAATLSIIGKADITAVAAMLGHANLNTVQIYLAALRSLEHSPAYLLASKIAPREGAER